MTKRMKMDEFLSSFPSHSGFIGGRTVIPGPMATPSALHGSRSVLTGNSGNLSFSQRHHPILTSQSQSQCTENIHPAQMSSSASIVRTDLSSMISWLSHPHTQSESQAVGGSGMYETPRPPKPYSKLTTEDCVSLVAHAIGSIVKHTCNDDFRHQCFTKLGVTGAAFSGESDVQREIKCRLSTLVVLEQQEQEEEEDDESNEVPVEQLDLQIP